MTRRDAFLQLVLSRLREFYREPEAVFWVYGFPLILAVVLGVAFSSAAPEAPTVDVQESPRAQEVADALTKDGLAVEVKSEEQCQERLKSGKTALYLVPAPDGIKYVYDQARSEGVLARHWVESVLHRRHADPALTVNEETVSAPGSRYIDFLLPGLIGMNIMGGGLFGVGFVLVDMRVRKLFKRLMATPMRRGDFLLSLLAARLVFLLPEMIALLVVGYFAFGVPMQGSFLALLLAIIVGAMAFAGIGLLIGCRTEKTETISGLINAVILPMYLLCGVFFSSKRFPDAVQPFIQALPLTQLNDALREIMLEGAGLTGIAWRLAVLALWGGVTFYLALRWFRWR